MNLAKTLFIRAYRICSHFIAMDLEFKRISSLLLLNGYPKRVVDSCLKSVLQKIYNPGPVLHTVPRKEIVIVLPFTGKHCLIVRTKLTKLFRLLYPMASLRVIFSPTFKLGHLFKFKDVVPSALQSMVVYEFRCSSCNARYVGQTTRHLATRIAEHLGISPRTHRILGAPCFSAIREHRETTGHTINANDFSILSKAKQKYDLAILESLHIFRTRPSLNTMQGALELQLFRT